MKKNRHRDFHRKSPLSNTEKSHDLDWISNEFVMHINGWQKRKINNPKDTSKLEIRDKNTSSKQVFIFSGTHIRISCL